MDLQLHYTKIRQEESRMADEFPVIVSNETSDGGKAGVFAEVTRRIAARFITMGLARLANGEEKKIFEDTRAEARRIAIEVAQRATLSATALTLSGLEHLRAVERPKE
jgi:hypothetical protein